MWSMEADVDNRASRQPKRTKLTVLAHEDVYDHLARIPIGSSEIVSLGTGIGHRNLL